VGGAFEPVAGQSAPAIDFGVIEWLRA